MRYDMVKFTRGQVWMVRFKSVEAVGHEQKKDRPWLVLSVDRFNKSSGMVTMVPITTRDSIVSPSQVLFYNERGIKNVILCENIRTFDYSSGAYIFDFMGNISDEVLEKVDVAISIHLGLHYSPLTLSKLYESMEAIIKSVSHMQQKAETPVFTDDDVLQFAEKLQMLASEPAPVEEKDTTPVIKEVEEPVSTIEEKIPTPVKQITKSTVKNSRMKWTPEICKEFLEDAESQPMKKVMEKWNIMKKSRFYSMKNYAATLLKKND